MYLFERVFCFLIKHKLKFLTLYTLAAAGLIYSLANSPKVFETTTVVSIQPAQQSTASSDGQLNRLPTPLSVEQAARSQIALIESEEVARRVIEKIGVNKLAAGDVAAWKQTDEHVRQWIDTLINGKAGSDMSFVADAKKYVKKWTGTVLNDTGSEMSVVDIAYLQLANSIDARFEPNTNLITVRVRNHDPALAKLLAGSLIDAFVERYYELYSGAGTAFFDDQRNRSAERFEKLSAKLANFSRTNNVFDVSEQRRLLLQERTRMSGALSTTEGQIRQAAEQADTIPRQLAKMKPVGRLAQVTGLTDGKSASPGAEDPKEKDGGLTARLAENPPILLVRVYQDTIAELVRLKIDLQGYDALQRHQLKQLKDIDEQLSTLSAKEAEYDRLKLEVTQARQGTEVFNRRLLEEGLNQDMNSSMLASVRVVQRATMPLAPIWPNMRIVAALAFVLMLLPFLFILGRSITAPPAMPLAPAAAPTAAEEPPPLPAAFNVPIFRNVVKHPSSG